MRARPPIIIIGMHRSGTSLITRMLEALGLFVGKKKDPNNEALFFLRINDWILRWSGGAWDYPGAVQSLLEHKEGRELLVAYSSYLMKSPRIISFLGWAKYLMYRSPDNLDIPWGWKDPRNTFTLPLWLELFPNAKVIHIYRHGVDVANSMKTRRVQEMSRVIASRRSNKLVGWLRLQQVRLGDTFRCTSLEGGLSLWEEYLQKARAHVSSLQDRAIELRYETLLAEPYGIVKDLVHFCDLPVNEQAIGRVAEQVKKEHAYTYRSNPELRAFAQNEATRLRVYGYSA